MTSYKLFGTDGVRGRFREGLLTPPLLSKLGHAIGLWIQKKEGAGDVLFARDTRASGLVIEELFAHQFHILGIPFQSLGILPTPALAYHVKNRGALGGIMISASHNPADDNGIKLFVEGGEKLSQAQEHEIEALFSKVETPNASSLRLPEKVFFVCQKAERGYQDFLLSTLPSGFSLKPLKIVLDCAHGAAFRVAPETFKSLGAEVIVVGASPNGSNINAGCGALDLAFLSQAVRQENADVGIALDGDGDRLLLVDQKGNAIDGDQILALLASAWQEEGRLTTPTIVSTIMANGAFKTFLDTRGITLERTPVGDRYVAEMLSKHSLPLGGEPSGHLILKEFNGSGDGLLVALHVLRVALKKGGSLKDLFPLFDSFPQKLWNIPLPSFERLSSVQTQDFLTQTQQQLEAEGGRLLVRPSGTEPLLRLFVEAPSRAIVEGYLQQLVNFFKD